MNTQILLNSVKIPILLFVKRKNTTKERMYYLKNRQIWPENRHKYKEAEKYVVTIVD